MRRSLILLSLLFVYAGAPAAPAPGRPEVKIAWYGQSMFEIVTTKGTRIVLDPHNLEA